MSFDLAVWHEPERISDDRVAAVYARLCEAEPDVAVPTHPRVAAFHRDLTERFPDLDADPDDSPWAAPPSSTVSPPSTGWSSTTRRPARPSSPGPLSR